MPDFKIIFIHGYTSSHLADWYPQIARALDLLGVDYAIPDLPGHKTPHAADWLSIIDREVKAANKPVVLVGHSLGTRAALLYLDTYKVPVRAVVLIAAFANRTENATRRGGTAYPDFFEHTLDIPAIKKLSPKFVVIHSLDDPSIDIEQGQEIAQDLGADLVTVDDRGHLYRPENAPFILDVLSTKLGFSSTPINPTTGEIA